MLLQTSEYWSGSSDTLSFSLSVILPTVVGGLLVVVLAILGRRAAHALARQLRRRGKHRTRRKRRRGMRDITPADIQALNQAAAAPTPTDARGAPEPQATGLAK